MIAECPGCKSRYDVTGRPGGTRARCRCGTSFLLPEPPDTAGALQCPQCGSPCAPDRTTCLHCEAPLAVVACPRCFGMIFQGAKHCAHCGAEVGVAARPIEAAGKPLACPRCGPASEGLVAHLIAETLLDVCGRCAGLWLDVEAFDRVTAERDRATALAALGAANIHATTVIEAKVSYIRCPECAAVMNRTNFGRRSGIVLDVCKSHGAWFDKDELRQVLAFVDSGGLEKARAKQILDLKEQETAARQAERASLRTQAAFTRHVEPRRMDAIDFLSVLAALIT
jgi:Zn-finger nucleic acid-binding protein